MQSEAKVVGVYVEAFLELALENAKVEELETELIECTQLLCTDPGVWKFFSSPVIKARSKVQVLESAFKDKVDRLMLHFLAVLARRGRLNELPLLGKLFRKEADRLLGRCRIQVSSAQPLQAEEEQKLVAALRQYFDKEIVLSTSTRTDLIGGLRLVSEELIVDASVQNRLKRIGSALLKHRIVGEKFYEN